MDLASLRDAKPAGLYGVADAYGKLGDAFGDHVADWQRGTVQAVQSAGWSGQAADSAQASLAATDDKLQAAGLELGTINGQLRDSADAFQLARSKLLQALADAQAQGFSVNECGAVSWAPPPAAQRHDNQVNWQAQQQSAANGISTRISGALAEATSADQALAATLKAFAERATSGNGLDLQTASVDRYQSDFELATPTYLDGVPGAGAGPAQWNTWWKGLTPDEQQWFIADHPELLGNQDGIPAQVRDEVNRAYLAQTLKSLTDKEALGPLSKEDEDTLKKLQPIQGRLNEDAQYAGDGRPQDYLLGIGTEGQGRAIISFGDPDTATDISAYVPGMTSDPASLGAAHGVIDGSNEAENALNTWRSAQAKEPAGRSVASVVWLGYDAPPDSNLSAASSGRAQAGAPAYAKFLTGLRATNDGAPHITSIGHSYGSLLVGEATRMSTQQGSPYSAPDDVVLIGSPGAGVNSAKQLGMPGHVWVGAAENDPVTHLPSREDTALGALGGPLLGSQWAHQTDPNGLWYGTDPASAAFGAQRFAVSDWTCTDPISAHLKYLTPNNGGPSLNNVGSIVTGDYSHVRREADR
ncbi:alpha/beta hydrolase [Kitasatospora sp. NBC_01287]|uniref:alpha/beta hydrolase n=1 Tax=Kitasatospora sp. NBC_01287 TaxID=2903573 RepID=UPI00225381B1|nr:alpha/beta hydrolase [Kitasatospora sp. NBC_01287]MCX4748759.1 alpha/beta hydrolase [Kitasatospora sp. NBC_01287]